MSSSIPRIQPLAQRLLRSSRGDDQGHNVAALSRVLHGFYVHTSPLLGERGFYLLLARALNRAQCEHPLLQGVKVEHNGNDHLGGLAEAFEESSDHESATAGETLISEFIALIVRFLGADMAIRLVRQSFPDFDAERDGPISQDDAI